MTVEHNDNSDKVDIILKEDIRSKIHNIRGIQVILDRDLSGLYHVETRTLNQAVKRNRNRFPVQFCFQLSNEEFENWRSQNVMSKGDRKGLRRPPYAFTEQGVAMLSAVLKSDIAVGVSIGIMNAFIEMRRFISSNALLFQRLEILEMKQLKTERDLDNVLSAIERGNIQPVQGIFFDGQIFDAYKFVSDLFRSATSSIVIIDNYVDDTVLAHLTKRSEGVEVKILTRKINETLKRDVERFNEQYPPIEILPFNDSHDRFIILDRSIVYHFGASLKDLGKKWFAFSKMDIGALDMLSRLEKVI